MKLAVLTRLPVTWLHEMLPTDSLHYYCTYADKTLSVLSLLLSAYKRISVSELRLSVVAGVAQLFVCSSGEMLLVIVQLWGDI